MPARLPLSATQPPQNIRQPQQEVTLAGAAVIGGKKIVSPVVVGSSMLKRRPYGSLADDAWSGGLQPQLQQVNGCCSANGWRPVAADGADMPGMC